MAVSTRDDADRDEERTQNIEKYGYRVVRYWNSEVLSNIDGVLADIWIRAQDIT